MSAQQRFHRGLQIALEEQRLLRGAPIARGGDGAGVAPQADKRRRELKYYRLVAKRVHAADEGLDLAAAGLERVVNGKR